MSPNPDRIGPKRRTMFRDWLALLPWYLIYPLGAVLLIALIGLLSR
jgi:hypothetical protein